jgi:lipopolysaccharide export system protein LptA
LALSGLVLCGASLAQGASSDRKQAVQILSDESRYEEAEQLTTLKGHVVLTQGSLLIRAAQMQIRQKERGHFLAVALGGEGQSASFQQTRGRASEQSIQAQADTMEYDSQSETLRLIGRASLKRLSGAKVTEETVGQLITFQLASEVFSVSGGTPSATNPSGRVRTVISPRGSAEKAAIAASAPPLTPATQLPEPAKGRAP